MEKLLAQGLKDQWVASESSVPYTARRSTVNRRMASIWEAGGVFSRENIP
jgi:hypothetical protein